MSLVMFCSYCVHFPCVRCGTNTDSLPFDGEGGGGQNSKYTSNKVCNVLIHKKFDVVIYNYYIAFSLCTNLFLYK